MLVDVLKIVAAHIGIPSTCRIANNLPIRNDTINEMANERYNNLKEKSRIYKRTYVQTYLISFINL